MMDVKKINENVYQEIREKLEQNKYKIAIQQFLDLHPNDQVEVFDLLSPGERLEILKRMDILATAKLFSLQEDQDTLEAAESLTIDRLADILDEMAPDEAADLLLDLPPDQAAEALEQMVDAEEIIPLLEYPDDSAGGRMTTDFVAITENITANQAINLLREISPDASVPYYIFVTDSNNHLVGVTGLRELVVAKPYATIQSIMNPEVISVDAWLDQEEVSQVMAQYDLTALPVVNHHHEMVGVITHDDVLDVIQEEATEDIYLLASVTDSELEPDSPIFEQLKGRLPWLILNMGTALFAAWVISNFEDIIALVAVLAVFQSVVAGLGGNAASQSVAMFVRAIALGKVPTGKRRQFLFRQMAVGLFQGVIIGSLVGIGVTVWKGNPYLGMVLGLALIGNMILAGIAGSIFIAFNPNGASVPTMPARIIIPIKANPSTMPR
ncbi:MAG: magnesium transporter [Anaerolineales bacterium]